MRIVCTRGIVGIGLGVAVLVMGNGCSDEDGRSGGNGPGRARQQDVDPATLRLTAEEAQQLQKTQAEAAGVPVNTTNAIGMELVFVPPGSFRMGSPPEESHRNSDEGPRARVRISQGFYMSAHEVTNGQFRQFRPSHDSRSRGRFSLNDDKQPVVEVNWADAVAFCRWLSRKEGKTYRLPTEAEWEYACRAGTQTAFHWGDAFDPERANARDTESPVPLEGETNEDPYPVSAPVGSFPPNAWGLYDMHGNAYEWCQGWYAKYRYELAPAVDPPPPPKSEATLFEGEPHRLRRGGSWGNSAPYMRAAIRLHNEPETRDCFHGFRVVCEVPADGAD